jgi:hypothetical protein
MPALYALAQVLHKQRLTLDPFTEVAEALIWTYS